MFKFLGILLVVYGFGFMVSYAVHAAHNSEAMVRVSKTHLYKLASLWFVGVWKHVIVPSYKWFEQKLIETFG